MAHDVILPSVTALAWIPFLRPTSRKPDGFAAYADAAATRLGRKLRGKAIEALFYSGNQPPPYQMGGLGAYEAVLSAKHYRGTLCLFDASLRCYDDGRPCSIICRALLDHRNVGYTPVRLPVLSPLVWFSGGRGATTQVIQVETPAGGELSQTVYFRLGKLVDSGNRVLTGHWAPEAWMRVVYRAWRDGRYQVDFFGSLIPSQSFYLDWVERATYDVATIPAEAVRQFIEAGGGDPAPGMLLCTLTGTAPCVSVFNGR